MIASIWSLVHPFNYACVTSANAMNKTNTGFRKKRLSNTSPRSISNDRALPASPNSPARKPRRWQRNWKKPTAATAWRGMGWRFPMHHSNVVSPKASHPMVKLARHPPRPVSTATMTACRPGRRRKIKILRRNQLHMSNRGEFSCYGLSKNHHRPLV